MLTPFVLSAAVGRRAVDNEDKKVASGIIGFES